MSRRTASSCDVRLPEPAIHHHRAASSSALSLIRTRPFARPPTPPPADHRFSRLFPSFLGSPYLYTAELPSRPSSPAPTADFSIIDPESDNPFIPGSYPPSSPSNSLKSLLPRLFQVLSSPSRSILNFSPTINTISSSSSRSSSPNNSPRRRPPQSWYTNTPSSTYWAPSSLGKSKGKGKVTGRFSGRNGTTSRKELSEHVNYSDLAPLDGEEGELIDDEACFIDVRAVTGIDILSMLPLELALHVLSLISSSSHPPCSKSTAFYLNAPISPGRTSVIIGEADTDHHESLKALLACRLVSRTWCRLASDNGVWRGLFLNRWAIDLGVASDPRFRTESLRRGAKSTLGMSWDYDMTDISDKAKRVLGLSSAPADVPIWAAPLRLDWRILYRERLELELRWNGSPCFPLDESRLRAKNNVSIFAEDSSVQRKRYDPKPMRITGHSDSVYCLEFDSRRIITGSRDKKIKVWSLQTGKLLGTFKGAHTGSVLCLKFEKDWDREWDWDSDEEVGGPLAKEEPRLARTGFMVSGSSDCTVCVWDLHLGPLMESEDDDVSICSRGEQSSGCDDGERQILAEVRATLKGHSLGVLDLRIDRRWIVSCSKDAVIRVWNRKTLELYRILRGHEGPVNAVGLQNGRVVSASGDGKLILWDIESGERLRTFEGHNRGLACIEYKGDLIVSGSNDCKIKIWSASTGECLRDLTGHEALVRALSFDVRSGRLVSASYDRSIKVWDLATGRLVREFKGHDVHTSHIFDVKFDVSRIVSTSHDQKIVVHDFSAGLNTGLFV